MYSETMNFLISFLVLSLVFISEKVLSEEFHSPKETFNGNGFQLSYENYGAGDGLSEQWMYHNEGTPSDNVRICNNTGNNMGVIFPLRNGTEYVCLKKCSKGRTCENDQKCIDFPPIFNNKCVQTCTVDGDCEYPKKCMNLPQYTKLENKFCFWPECTKKIGCEYPLECNATFFGYRCARRYCFNHPNGKCREREKCNLYVRGCECADGMSGNNCQDEAWCKDNGKYKDCRGTNGTCGYNLILNAVECRCERFSNKRLHPEENRCRETCNADSDCENGGVCEKKGENKFCTCKSGLIGDKCETVFDCTPEGKYKDCEKSGGKCFYDGTEAICKCFGNKILNDKDYICKVCECGAHGTCKFVDGQKLCDCEQSFLEVNGTCTKCECGPHGICKFENGQKKCDCKKSFLEVYGTCTGCICRGGECVNKDGKPFCKCPPGYGNFTSDSCKACDCGPNINCIWKGRFGGSKICLCEPGFSTLKGKCAACDCGHDSKCEWISEEWLKQEKKLCHCKPGYHEKNGKCVEKETSATMSTTETSILSTSVSSTIHDIGTITRKSTTESFLSSSISSTVPDCNCGSFSYSCVLDFSGEKICNCFIGYSQLDGSCTECNCGPYGVCSIEYGRKKCICRSSSTEINGVCVDKQDFKTFLMNILDKVT